MRDVICGVRSHPSLQCTSTGRLSRSRTMAARTAERRSELRCCSQLLECRLARNLKRNIDVLYSSWVVGGVFDFRDVRVERRVETCAQCEEAVANGVNVGQTSVLDLAVGVITQV